MTKDVLWNIVKRKKQERTLMKSDAHRFSDIFSEKKARIIAEVKRASPQFDFSDQLDVTGLIKYYGTHRDIDALSILIDREFFKWDPSYAYEAKQYKKPLFFKEFIVEKEQILWAAYFWYDGLLLLEKSLTTEQLLSFAHVCSAYNIFPIIEVDSEEALQKIFSLELPKLSGIWINARNLTTMEMRPDLHLSLAKKYVHEFSSRHMFAFSWYDSIASAYALDGLYDGVLIWTGLVKSFLSSQK